MKPRHWTQHAFVRLQERYGESRFPAAALDTIVDRIESRYRTLFDRPFWATRSRIIILAKIPRDGLDGSDKVRFVYQHRARVIITVLPPGQLWKCALHTLRI